MRQNPHRFHMVALVPSIPNTTQWLPEISINLHHLNVRTKMSLGKGNVKEVMGSKSISKAEV